MEQLIQFLSNPWPWWVTGPIIGLTVPALLLVGNKPFGISSNLRHICAICIPGDIEFFNYNWKKESWNLFFVFGIIIGSFIGGFVLPDPNPIQLNESVQNSLISHKINSFQFLNPVEIFSWEYLFSLRSLVFTILGGFMVGFGTRYAGGCTSGHSIFGISTLQWPSLVATICFMIGGFFATHILIPLFW